MAEAAILDGISVEITGGYLDWETPKAETLSEKVSTRIDALLCLLLLRVLSPPRFPDAGREG